MGKAPIVLFAAAAAAGVAYNSFKAIKLSDSRRVSIKTKELLEKEFKKPYTQITDKDVDGNPNLATIKGSIAASELMYGNATVNIAIFTTILLSAIYMLRK